jgi:heme exporter protein A
VLEAQALSCVKQDRELFSGLDICIRPGQLIHLLGPNGAGKTSLLRILAGLSQPETGHVNIFKDVARSNATALPNATTLSQDALPLLYLGHKLALNKHLSAVENLTYWAASQHRHTDAETLYPLLAKFELVGLEDIPCGQLSAGQQRRVSLARTALVDTGLWILDEPYTSLDVAGVALIQAQIDEFVRQGGAVIMTSHQALQSSVTVDTFTLEYQI